jgi:hypothetical protein
MKKLFTEFLDFVLDKKNNLLIQRIKLERCWRLESKGRSDRV